MEELPIRNPWPGAVVYYRDRTTSTMDEAAILARGSAVDGTVVVAGFQERGRGRLEDRTWHASPNESLLFTILFRTASLMFPPTRLPILVGLAEALAIEELYGINCQIKWPNDILVVERKLSGILCEGYRTYVLAGVGINCDQQSFPPAIEHPACSLRQLLGCGIAKMHLLEAILEFLRQSLGDRQWRQKVHERLFMKGEAVLVRRLHGPTTGTPTEGTLTGLDTDGALIITAGNGTRTIVTNGEVTRCGVTRRTT